MNSGLPKSTMKTSENAIGTTNGTIGVTYISERPRLLNLSQISTVFSSSGMLHLQRFPSTMSSAGHTNEPQTSATGIMYPQ